MSKEAMMKLALEALKMAWNDEECSTSTHIAVKRGIKALEEALAGKQEQEGNVCARCGGIVFDPVIKQDQGEPVAWRAWMKSASPDHKGGEYRWSYLSHPIMQDVIKNEPLYTTPQQRTWVGLTNEEKQEVWAMNETAMVILATEAKLKEKNATN